MTIYSMTATFGKLEQQTLQLQPGLNVIQRPNEWGKSTWCAFLVTMLYGLETSKRNNKSGMADKNRYAPWSGMPMAGRIDLRWNERDITIERGSKGRTPMGEFRAYETASGLEVSELTSTNCGEMLLGVERSVFQRAGFLRLSDLPVTEDDALRRRLNALVTTGDESDTGDLLAQKLKKLKNTCRSNSVTGLIPQAEAQKRELEGKLRELQLLQQQSQEFAQRQQALVQKSAALENHRQALQYASVQANLHRVEQAHLAAEAAATELARLEDTLSGQPSRQESVERMHRHTQLQQAMAAALQEFQQLPPEPLPPQVSQQFATLTPEQAIYTAQQDRQQVQALETQQGKKKQLLSFLLLFVAILGGILGLMLQGPILGGILLVSAGLASLLLFLLQRMQHKQLRHQLDAIYSRYPYPDPQRWVEDAEFYAESLRQYQQAQQEFTFRRAQVQQRIDEAGTAMEDLLQGMDSQSFLLQCNQRIAAHDALIEARRTHHQAAAHAEALRSMIRPVEKPAKEDDLPYTESQTQQLLQDCAQEQRQLQIRMGQFQGRMQSLGTEAALHTSLEAVNARLAQLQQTNTALELALHTLEDATAQLQRRFAPRIAQQAQDLFSRLTAGRYQRLTLQQDLSALIATEQDIETLPASWRSEGTIDQMYLAMRLAVARELTPSAPLILDDALVRFDDTRHAAAMEILHQEAEHKQVILFTCQTREQ